MICRQQRAATHNSTLFLVTSLVVATYLFQFLTTNIDTVSGFLFVVPQHVQKLSSTSSYSSSASLVSSRRKVLKQHKFDDASDGDDDDDVFLTPIQIRTIRKDIIRKRANQKLPTIYYNNDDNYSSINPEKLNINEDGSSAVVSVEQQIIDALISNQLVQVRGIALQDNDTRGIRSDAEQLAYRIQKRIQKQQQQQQQDVITASKSSLAHVFVVEMKGHMATLFYYIPQQQLTTPFHQQHQRISTAVLSSSSSSSSTGTSRLQNVASPKVQLRTTGKRNDWNKRPKALRDNAGQIIK